MTGTPRISWPIAGAACVAVLIEAASNAMFAYSLGYYRATVFGLSVLVDGALLALGSVAVAVFQANLATGILQRQKGAPLWLPLGVLIVCLGYSVGAMASHLLEMQRRRGDALALPAGAHAAARGGQANAQRAYDDAAAAIDRTGQELARLGTPRAAAVIRAEITGARVALSVTQSSKGCTENLGQDWIAAGCSTLLAMRRDLASAEKAEQLAERQAAQRKELVPLAKDLQDARERLAGEHAPSAPSAFEAMLSQVLPWAFAVAVMLCGTFGFAAASRPAKVQPPAPAVPVVPPAASPAPLPRPRAPAKPSSLSDLLQGLTDGTTTAPGCAMLPDGWIDAPQRALANVLGISPGTVCRGLQALEASGSLAVRVVGRKSHLKLTTT